MNIQLMPISDQKTYGSKDVRAYLCLEPVQSDGGQERGLRGGTASAPLGIGLGAAAELAEQAIRNGDPEQTYSGCLNQSFAYVEGEPLQDVLMLCHQ
uniref:Uncharacterized protein n=1 Tax=Glossina pallidipes TaxID=7398 RepID=A0A1A9Z791_GLOPL